MTFATSGMFSEKKFYSAGVKPCQGIIFLRCILFILVAAAFIFTSGFALFAIHVSGLSTPSNPTKADAIIVLTGSQARLDAALGLLKTRKGERLLISGVDPAATRRQLQIATDSNNSLFNRVDIDRAALDTIGNAEESAKWLR